MRNPEKMCRRDRGADGPAIKLGGIGPLTGPAAIYGNAAKNGTEIAVEEINAMGGIQFELSSQDDEHDAEDVYKRQSFFRAGATVRSDPAIVAPGPRRPRPRKE